MPESVLRSVIRGRGRPGRVVLLWGGNKHIFHGKGREKSKKRDGINQGTQGKRVQRRSCQHIPEVRRRRGQGLGHRLEPRGAGGEVRAPCIKDRGQPRQTRPLMNGASLGAEYCTMCLCEWNCGHCFRPLLPVQLVDLLVAAPSKGSALHPGPCWGRCACRDPRKETSLHRKRICS